VVSSVLPRPTLFGGSTLFSVSRWLWTSSCSTLLVVGSRLIFFTGVQFPSHLGCSGALVSLGLCYRHRLTQCSLLISFPTMHVGSALAGVWPPHLALTVPHPVSLHQQWCSFSLWRQCSSLSCPGRGAALVSPSLWVLLSVVGSHLIFFMKMGHGPSVPISSWLQWGSHLAGAAR